MVMYEYIGALLGFVIISIFLGSILVSEIKELIKAAFTTTKTVNATIIHMEEHRWLTGHSCHITFELDTKELLKLQIPGWQYDDFAFYEYGELSYRGELFISFEAKHTKLMR